MKSAASYFKVSTAVIKDDFRRFWAIPVIGFIYYFFSSIFFILMNMKELSGNEYGNDMLANFLVNLLEGHYVFNIVNIGWMAVLSVLLVFRYLHNSGHAIAVHSQPFTRATLLNSHTVSCILFIAIPIVLTGIILMLISQPVYFSNIYYEEYSGDMVNLFARVNIIRWMWQSFLMGMFIMVIAIASGMVTGTPFHHAVAALGFNGVAPLCTLLLTQYFNTYLFGYVQPDWLSRSIVHMSPVINVMDDGFMSLSENIYYVVIVVLMYALAMFLYNKRKLERATDGIVFKAVDVLITLVFGYLGMTALGLAFFSIFDESKGATTVGYIAGAILGMIIVRMVIMKTVRVFNKKTVIMMGSYLVIALVFFGCLNFNLTGYETRVEEDADSIDVSFTAGNVIFKGGKFDDADAKAAIVDLHKLIISNKQLIKEADQRDESDYSTSTEAMMYISFDYYKNEGDDAKRVEARSYVVPTYLILNSDEMKAFASAGALNERAIDELPATDKIQYIDVRSGSYYSSTPYGASGEDYDMLCSDKTQLAGLMEALKKDIHDMTYDDMKRDYNMPIVVSLNLTYIDDDGTSAAAGHSEDAEVMMIPAKTSTQQAARNNVRTRDMDIDLTAAYKNTIAWLEANGYGEMTKYDPSYWNFAVVYDVENGNTTAADDSDAYSLSAIPQSSEGMNVISDSAVIRNLYENASSHVAIGALSDMSTSENNIYMVKFYHKDMESDSYYAYFNAYIDGSYYLEQTEANEQ